MATAQICATVTGRTTAELRARRDEVVNADLIELRLDTVRDPDVAGALADRSCPVVVTCRPLWEGGHFTGAEEDRKRLLADALRLGADYVDIEWNARFDDLIASSRGRHVVLSLHDFRGVPRDLTERMAAMRSTGAEVVKLAVMAKRLSDCLVLLETGRTLSAPTVLIAMGEPGIPTRVLPTRFGSCWSYAGDGVAPGQIPIDRLVQEFRIRNTSPRTTVYGVVGRPVSHSLSPVMHNAAFATAGEDSVYIPLAAADFDDFRAFANAMRIEGVSVTAPFKVDAFEAASELDALSRRVRSVNTLRRVETGWAGCTTDVAGFLKPLESAMPVKGKRATILGAGGAARAVADALRSAGARVSIAARHPEQGQQTAAISDATAVEWPPRGGTWDVLVNATPVGTFPDAEATPLPSGPFTGELVYDLVYNPIDTRLLREARAAGCQAIGGLDMLVAQAELQFEWWTHLKPIEGVMRRAAVAALTTMVTPEAEGHD
jgi:3-dehydroquinate dehydratase/shikimate dehydrogenase